MGLLVLENGMIKRDTWTSNFGDVVAALSSPSVAMWLRQLFRRQNVFRVLMYTFPILNLREAIEEALGKAPGDPITIRRNGYFAGAVRWVL